MGKKDSGWHDWFAWYPVRDVYGRWHWLDRVYRSWSRAFGGWTIVP